MNHRNSFGGPFLAVPVWAVDDICTHGHPSTLQVLVGMVSLMERHTLQVEASTSVIADHVNLSKETVKRAIRWMRERGILTVDKSSQTAMNVYVVEYQRPALGSPMTLATSKLGSPMTLADPGLGGAEHPTRVTGDPSKIPLALTQQGKPETSIEIVPMVLSGTEVLEGKEIAAHPVEVTLIIGADPDARPVVASPALRAKKPKGEVNDIVGHFIRHPQVVMHRDFSLQEVNVVRRTVKLLVQSGLQRLIIRQMIDKFFSQEKFRTSERAVYLFASKQVQQELLASVGGLIVVDDPVLQLMLHDFVRDTEELPWETADDMALQKAVIDRGLDACYRYPELVASLALVFGGGFSSRAFIDALSDLNDLIVGVASGSDRTSLGSLLPSVSAHLTLPSELKSFNSEKVRESASTISEAVYRYRRIARV